MTLERQDNSTIFGYTLELIKYLAPIEEDIPFSLTIKRAFLERSYSLIEGKVVLLTFDHFQSIEKRYLSGVSSYSIDFVNRPIYVHTSLTKDSKGRSPALLLSHSSPVYNYMHTMLQAINSSENRIISHTTPFTYSKKSYEYIKKSDLVLNFKYKENGVDVSNTLRQDGKMKDNPDAVKIFLKEVDKYKAILQNAFSSYPEEYKLLQKSSDSDLKLICSYSLRKACDNDCVMEMHLCIKLFLYAQTTADLCLKTAFDDNVILGETQAPEADL